MRGGFSPSEHEDEVALVRATLAEWALSEPHWAEYLQAWHLPSPPKI